MSWNENFGSVRELRAHLRRRAFLKAAGVGVATSVAGVASTAAQSDSVAKGPFSVGAFEAKTVDPEDLPTPSIPNDPDIIGEGAGESEEVPRGSPESDGGTAGPGPRAQSNIPGGALTVTKDFDGFTTRDVVRGVDFDDDGTVQDDEIFFGVPSDNQLATGWSHHVTAINSEIGFIRKGVTDSSERQGGQNDATGDEDDYITHLRLEDFFEPVLSLDQDDEGDPTAFQFENMIVFDPRARFDRTAGDNGRFYVACVEFNLSDTVDGNEVDDPSDFTGAFLLAVSSTADPNDPWTIYRIPPRENGGLVDYPTLGYDGDAVYLAQNFFGFDFEGATLTVLDKSDLLAGNDVDGWEFSKLRNPDGSLAFTLQPAAGSGYLVNSRFQEGQTVTVWNIDVPDGAFADTNSANPTIDNGSVSVAPYANAPGAEQPDTNKKTDTLDTRLLNLAWDGSHLWTAHTIAPGYVRWYELDPSAPSLVQSGTYQRENWSTFLPAVEANGESMVLVHNVGAETEYTGVEVAGRTDEYEDGKLQDQEVVHSGEVAYNYDDTDGSFGPGGEENVLRWGDYNGAAVDPQDGTYWVIGQYAKDPTPDSEGPKESELYGTRIANVTFD